MGAATCADDVNTITQTCAVGRRTVCLAFSRGRSPCSAAGGRGMRRRRTGAPPSKRRRRCAERGAPAAAGRRRVCFSCLALKTGACSQLTATQKAAIPAAARSISSRKVRLGQSLADRSPRHTDAPKLSFAGPNLHPSNLSLLPLAACAHTSLARHNLEPHVHGLPGCLVHAIRIERAGV